jgi:hypothetical protein
MNAIPLAGILVFTLLNTAFAQQANRTNEMLNSTNSNIPDWAKELTLEEHQFEDIKAMAGKGRCVV